MIRVCLRKKKREKSVPVKSNPIQQRERDSEELYKMKDLYRQKGAGRGSSARKLLLQAVTTSLSFRRRWEFIRHGDKVACGMVVKNLLCIGKIPQSRKWQSTPVFLPEKSHRGAWWATVPGVTKSWTPLSTHAQESIRQMTSQLC